jgi:RHS repeat-associated protein
VYPVQYGYDLVGNLKSITYPSGRVVQQSLDSLERITQISSSGTNYLSSMAYNSAWQPTGFSYDNGVQATFSYNSHMQLASLAYTKSGSALFSLNYDYTTGVPGNNGQIQKITDNVDATRTSTIVYDAWLRLKSWTNSQAALTESYDRYSNRLTQNLPVPSTVTVDATTNHITTTGFTYDAAGNMTNDSVNALTYDGENRVITSTQSGATYTYAFDGNGLRVMKTPPTGAATAYIFSGAKVVAEYASGAVPASPTSEYIYAGSQLIATLAGSATTYHHPDHLSARVSTDSNGNTVRTFGHYPFGETWYETGTVSKWKFTSYERDAESLNDYAIARIYANRQGRFLSTDPLSGSTGNPQSLNRYAYVADDSLNLVDPTGMFYGPCGPLDVLCPPSSGDGSSDGVGSGGVRYRILLILKDDGGNTSGTTIGPAPRPGPPCRIVDPFFAALEFTGKLGPEVQVGPVKAGFSLYKNFTTGDTGGKIEANAALVSAQVDNPTPMGGSLGGGTEGAQFSLSFLGFQYNFKTRSLKFNPSKSFSLGLQVLAGG